MTDNSNDDLRRRLEPQEQTSKAQQEALDNIQQILAQLLTNQNNNNTGRNHNEKEHNDDEQPKTESQRKVVPLMLKYLKASKLRSYP